MNRKPRLFLLAGGFLLILASGYLFYARHSKDSPWSVQVEGYRRISENDIVSLVSHYIQSNPENVREENLEKLLGLNPRIKQVWVSVSGKTVKIKINERETGYLEHNPPYITEHTPQGAILQERIQELGYLNLDQPILYLTASKDIEIQTLKSDIIRLWDRTKYAYSFIWTRISEIKIERDKNGRPELLIYTVKPRARIRLTGRFDKEAFRRLWAVFYYLEGLSPVKTVNVQIFDDHAVIL